MIYCENHESYSSNGTFIIIYWIYDSKKSLTLSATSLSILIYEINDRVNTCPDYKHGGDER